MDDRRPAGVPPPAEGGASAGGARPLPLELFDLRPGAMVTDLDETRRALLADHLRVALPGSPELAAIVDGIVATHPLALRTKELLESLECAKAAGQHVLGLLDGHRRLSDDVPDEPKRALGSDERARGVGPRPPRSPLRQTSDAEAAVVATDAKAGAGAAGAAAITEILDLACGHGLVGCLLAYRFPKLVVKCVDTQERSAWQAYLSAWRAHGVPARGNAIPLQNIEFIIGSLEDVLLSSTSCAVAVHACNEANLSVLERCAAARAAWVCVPCCIPEHLYMEGTRFAHLPDEVRYAAVVGVIAHRFEASRVTCFDKRISNRNLIVMGPRRAHA
jgi:hypothetical protein